MRRQPTKEEGSHITYLVMDSSPEHVQNFCNEITRGQIAQSRNRWGIGIVAAAPKIFVQTATEHTEGAGWGWSSGRGKSGPRSTTLHRTLTCRGWESRTVQLLWEPVQLDVTLSRGRAVPSLMEPQVPTEEKEKLVST